MNGFSKTLFLICFSFIYTQFFYGLLFSTYNVIILRRKRKLVIWIKDARFVSLLMVFLIQNMHYHFGSDFYNY